MRRILRWLRAVPPLFGKSAVSWCLFWGTVCSVYALRILSRTGHDPAALLGHLCAFLQPGGTLTVAHGMSREKINAHHSGSARPVSHPLPPAEEVAALFAPHLQVTCVRSDERMYLVTGMRAES